MPVSPVEPVAAKRKSWQTWGSSAEFAKGQVSSGSCSDALRVGKVQIEFDETSQLQRVRFGISATDAVFSVLDPQL
jgi:hypothetical protein